MERLIYTSVAASHMTPGDVFQIVQCSAANNAKRGITGCLIFASGQFFQVLEGSGEAIDALMECLAKDRRHHSITVIGREQIETPAFAQWRMKRLILGDTMSAHLPPEIANGPEAVVSAARVFLAIQDAA